MFNFNEIMPFIIAGLVSGSIYGLSGTGFVITYKTSGIFNFSHPVMAAVAAYGFYFLHYDTLYFNVQLSWPVSAAITILGLGTLMGLIMELVARGLARVATSLQVLATIGLALGIIGGLGLFYQNESALNVPPFLPQSTFGLFNTNVSWDQLILFVFAATSVAGLYAFFRYARMGMAMRAVVDNRDLVDLTGASSNTVARYAWIIGMWFAAASGVLLAPLFPSLSASPFFFFFLASFGAAALGAFRSLPLTFFGGLFIGVVASLCTDWAAKYNISWLNNIQPALPFLVLLIVLIVTPRSKLVDTRVGRPKPLPPSYYAPWKVRATAFVVIFTALALVPFIVGNDLNIWGEGLIYMILLLSLGLLVKESGQVSLCQTVFAAVGGVALAHAAADWGFPWPAALLFAGVMAALVGLVVAIPAIRVSGVFLALATLGFGLFLQNLFYPTSVMFTHSVDGLPSVPRPSFARGDDAYYWVVLTFAAVIALIWIAIHNGRLGRILRGLSDSPLALNTMGDSVNGTRIIVFAISAFVAGIAGALYASYFQAIGLETPIYQPFLALQLFAIVMLIRAGTPWYGLAAALGIEIVPAYVSKWFNIDNIQPYLSLLFGVSAVYIATHADRLPGMPQPLQAFFERFRGKPREISVVGLERLAPAGVGLEVENLTVRFGGVVAVDNLSLAAPYGRITGLIGPNGAGKTTTFNACSGLNRPTTGTVRFDGREVSRLPVARRARRGMGRTFQTAELWDALTVRDNVELGAEAPLAGNNYLAQLAAPPAEHRRTRSLAQEAMQLADISDLAERRVGDLSTGQRRLVELARVLAGPFDLLLLDEPSSGLDKAETDRFGALLQRIVHERGTGILLVEHDMTLVMEVCEFIHVMDFGHEIFKGTPSEVTTSEIVRAAYLGSEEVQVAELGTAAESDEVLFAGTEGNGSATEPVAADTPAGES